MSGGASDSWCLCGLGAGLGAACEIAAQEMQRDQEHIKRLSTRLYSGITSQLQARRLCCRTQVIHLL